MGTKNWSLSLLAVPNATLIECMSDPLVRERCLYGNRSRKLATTIPGQIRNTFVDLYRTKYYVANLTHFTELLDEQKNISISSSEVKILKSEYILPPKVTKAKKKRIKKELLTKKETVSI